MCINVWIDVDLWMGYITTNIQIQNISKVTTHHGERYILFLAQRQPTLLVLEQLKINYDK